MKRITTIILMVCLSLTMSLTTVNATTDLSKMNYDKKMVIVVDKNKPHFTKKQLKVGKTYAKYSKLDKLGRCGTVTAVVSKSTMPTGKRGRIGMYRPSGWPTKVADAKYDFIPG